MHQDNTDLKLMRSPKTVSRCSRSNVSRSKNLTGTARLIRDLAADVHANVQEWNKHYLAGVSVLRRITEEVNGSCHSQSVQKLCDKLESICDSLDRIVANLEQITHQLKKVASLENEPTNILFSTWPVSLFGHKVQFIYQAYSEEVRSKRTILEDVTRGCTDSWKTLHLAAWVHQPLISENVVTVLESLLTETGHR